MKQTQEAREEARLRRSLLCVAKNSADRKSFLEKRAASARVFRYCRPRINLVSGVAVGRGEYENCKTDRGDKQKQKIDAALRRGSVWIDFWRHWCLRLAGRYESNFRGKCQYNFKKNT
jgi:hypothetical protein